MVHRLRHVVAADDIAGVGNERSRREQAFRMAARELAALDVVAVVGEFRLCEIVDAGFVFSLPLGSQARDESFNRCHVQFLRGEKATVAANVRSMLMGNGRLCFSSEIRQRLVVLRDEQEVVAVFRVFVEQGLALARGVGIVVAARA